MSKRSNHFPRSAGIVMPLFSVPDDYGPGTLHGARAVVRWAAKAGFSWWQMLPLTLPDSTGSPYASPSTMGWGWHIIDREDLVRRGWLDHLPTPFPRRADRRGWDRYQRSLLWSAWQRFEQRATATELRQFRSFMKQEQNWLRRHVMFLALRDRFGDRPWWTWPVAWRSYQAAQQRRDPRLQHRMDFHAWVQWVAEVQWQSFRREAHRAGIRIIGDVPFFVRADSVAVWSQPELFLIEKNGQVSQGVGAPPDQFTPNGQWWGNPTYAWATHRRTGFAWWRRRLSWAAEKYDALRLDHFHGYLRTWTIPARSKNPLRGQWLKTPSLMLQLIRELPCSVIVEDLGSYFPAAEVARRQLGVHGTRVWEFGWNGMPNNPHAPSAIQTDTAYYSSTHDLPPVRMWLRQRARKAERRQVQAALGRSVSADGAITSVLQSPADLSLLPIADLLSRSVPPINRPGTMRGNWRWQLRADDLNAARAAYVRRFLRLSTRNLV